jgi:hypothetical protein
MPRRSSADVTPADLSRITVALLACIARGAKDSTTLIQVMDAFDVSSPTIARALGLSPISVRTALHRKRKRRTRGR